MTKLIGFLLLAYSHISMSATVIQVGKNVYSVRFNEPNEMEVGDQVQSYVQENNISSFGMVVKVKGSKGIIKIRSGRPISGQNALKVDSSMTPTSSPIRSNLTYRPRYKGTYVSLAYGSSSTEFYVGSGFTLRGMLNFDIGNSSGFFRGGLSYYRGSISNATINGVESDPSDFNLSIDQSEYGITSDLGYTYERGSVKYTPLVGVSFLKGSYALTSSSTGSEVQIDFSKYGLHLGVEFLIKNKISPYITYGLGSLSGSGDSESVSYNQLSFGVGYSFR